MQSSSSLKTEGLESAGIFKASCMRVADAMATISHVHRFDSECYDCLTKGMSKIRASIVRRKTIAWRKRTLANRPQKGDQVALAVCAVDASGEGTPIE